jgi:SAM-dependent methyltransferase
MSTHSIDLIISGQAFEHIEFFWRTWLEMVRVLKPGGKIFLIAPSRGPEHRYPVDCWRFYPDGFAALAKYGSLELTQIHTDWEPHTAPDSAPWGDTVGVFYKPAYSYLTRLRERIQYAVRRWLACN